MKDRDIFWDMENFANAYRNWLCVTMHGDNHHILFDVLYETNFTWILPEDSHRATSGRYLRERFEAETGLTCEREWVEWPCSFLEMMVGLAYAMESVLYDPASGDRAYVWFWEMMDNIGLADLTDDELISVPQSKWRYIDAVCRQVCERTYDRCGHGGLFPMKHPFEDQRTVELWFQMQEYVVEKLAYENEV